MPLTFEQLKIIYNMPKILEFFEICDNNIQDGVNDLDNWIGWGLRDKYVGMKVTSSALSTRSEFQYAMFLQNGDNRLFVRPSKVQELVSDNSFRNLLDAFKLCATKKLPIEFNKEGKHYHHPCLLSDSEYRLLLETLFNDFSAAFYNLYNDNNKEKISNLVKQKYNENDMLQLFGKEAINNVRYIVLHLIESHIKTSNYNDTDINKFLECSTNHWEYLNGSKKNNYIITAIKNNINMKEIIVQKISNIIKAQAFDINSIKIRQNKHNPNCNRFEVNDKIKMILEELYKDKDRENIDDYLMDAICKYGIFDDDWLEISENIAKYFKKLLCDYAWEQYLKNIIYKVLVNSDKVQNNINTYAADLIRNKKQNHSLQTNEQEKRIDLNELKSKLLIKNTFSFMNNKTKRKLLTGRDNKVIQQNIDNNLGEINNKNVKLGVEKEKKKIVEEYKNNEVIQNSENKDNIQEDINRNKTFSNKKKTKETQHILI